MFMMFGYIRDMTVKKFCKYGEYGSFEGLLFFFACLLAYVCLLFVFFVCLLAFGL